MNNRKKEKGITLIALAVTIIVMLILAGVTIAALTSENGIINQASKVKETSKVAKTEEEAKLEYSNLILEKQMEGHGEETELSDVIEKLEENGYETGEKDGKNYIKIGEYYYEIKLENAQVSIAKERTEGITVGSSKITAKKIAQTADKTGIYGEKVTNYTCPNTTGVSTWRIFYADTENIYLIADDYISFDNAPKGKKGTLITKHGDYMLAMLYVVKDYDGATSIDSTFANKWLSSYWKNNSTSTNQNIKAVAYILDTSVWNTLYKGENAEYAIGGPTVEMFVKSWNDTHSGEKQKACSADLDVDANGYGYKVKAANGDYELSSLLAQDEYNSIYVKSDPSKASGMWIASPSAYERNSLMYAGSYYFSFCSYNPNDIGFRPVVCLNSKVRLQKVSDGYEIITK